jgi:hypothetical protein
MAMTALDQRLLIFGGVILVIALILFLYPKLSKSKIVDKKDKTTSMPKSTGILLLLILLLPLFYIYAQEKPVTEFSIALMMISSTLLVILFGVFLWVFRDLPVFIGFNRYTLIRFAIIVYCYIIYFTIVSRGLSFLFNGLINPDAIQLTPEFEDIVIPALAIFTIICYRLTTVFGSKITELLSDLSRDVLLFSMLMLWLGFNVKLVGLDLSTPITILTMNEATSMGLFAAILGVGIEGFLLWVKLDLDHSNRLSGIDNFVEQFLNKLKPQKQKKLDSYLPHVISKPTPSPQLHLFDTFNSKLNSHFTIHFRKKILKASTLVKFVSLICLCSFMVVLVLTPYHNSVLLVPAYSTNLSIVTTENLPADIVFTDSEGIADILPGKVYAIPIVQVQYQNGSFLAPVSQRISASNSSKYLVTNTNSYLLLNLTKTSVDKEVSVSPLHNFNYDQTNNDVFNYRGFDRDAEIYYCLKIAGFDRVITLSMTNSDGEKQYLEKYILAYNAMNDYSLIDISQVVDIIVISDYTIGYSTDEQLMNHLNFSLNQTKIPTSFLYNLTQPALPFDITLSKFNQSTAA